MLLLVVQATALILAPRPFSRREVVAAAPALFFATGASATTARTAPADFTVIPEPTRPLAHYLDNAEKLASNLEWYANGIDKAVGAALDEQTDDVTWVP